MNVRHLMVPGLTATDVDHGALGGLVGDETPRARLVSSFPATVPVQETTLRTGAPPSVHGVLFGEEPPRTPSLIDPWHERLDLLLEGAGFAALEHRLREELERADVLLVSGCPVPARARRIVQPTPVAPDGFRLRVEDTFILCEPLQDGSSLPRTTIDAWLRTDGIERVLAPTAESAGAWMAPTDRGWILVASADWSFREAGRVFGRMEPDEAPVLLALGRAWPSTWPGAVHDWRVAPTVLVVAGTDASACFDAPLEGADRMVS
jgi:hypothetical protein